MFYSASCSRLITSHARIVKIALECRERESEACTRLSLRDIVSSSVLARARLESVGARRPEKRERRGRQSVALRTHIERFANCECEKPEPRTLCRGIERGRERERERAG